MVPNPAEYVQHLFGAGLDIEREDRTLLRRPAPRRNTVECRTGFNNRRSRNTSIRGVADKGMQECFRAGFDIAGKNGAGISSATRGSQPVEN